MPQYFANVPNRKPLLSLILLGEGVLTAEQTDYALRQWFAQRKEGKIVSYGEMVIRLGYLTPRLLEPYVALQKVLAAPPTGTRHLGTLILDAQMLKPSLLAEALKKQQESGKRLGEVLVEEGYLKKSQIAPLLRLQGRRFTARLLPPGPQDPWAAR